MTTYFIRRALLTIPTFLGVTLVAFGITRIVPGGPLERVMLELRAGAAGGEAGAGGGPAFQGQITQEMLDEYRKAFDLDKPWYQAYLLWLGRLVRLDLGDSYKYDEPVWDMIASRFPISIYFGLTGFLCAYLVSIPLGIAKALRHGSSFDFLSSAVVFIGYSIPGWALGILLMLVFASDQVFGEALLPLGDFRTTSYQQLPEIVKSWNSFESVRSETGQFDWQRLSLAGKVVDQVWHTLLPLLCYMVPQFATLTILMKNSLLENIGQDYVRTAYAKGLSPTRVIYWHVLRNSLIPLATGLGHALSLIMAGSFLIEYTFNIAGIGQLGYQSILARDYTVVLGILSINAILMMFGNIVSDVLYALIDPRIRFD